MRRAHNIVNIKPIEVLICASLHRKPGQGFVGVCVWKKGTSRQLKKWIFEQNRIILRVLATAQDKYFCLLLFYTPYVSRYKRISMPMHSIEFN